MKLREKILPLILVLTIGAGLIPASAADVRADMDPILVKIENSDNVSGVEGFIARLYKLAMGREHDQTGLDYWTGKLDSGEINASNIARFFFSCDEFYSLNYSREDYIKVLYRVFFDREPDSAGFDHWYNYMVNDGHTRREALEGFIYSQEWANVCASYRVVSGTGVMPSVGVSTTEGVKTFVNSLYSDFLGRSADEVGFKHWCEELTYMRSSAKVTASGFVNSQEFKNLWDQKTPEERVKIFYKVFLDREPDDKGLSYWASQTKGADAITTLYNGFCDSQEFKEKCRANGIIVNYPSSDPVYNGVENIDDYYPVFNGTETVMVYGHYDRELAEALFNATNDYRIANGLGALAHNDDLQRTANLRARELVYNTSHVRPDGSAPFTAFPQVPGSRGENLIHANFADVKAYMNGWDSSPGHRANMLNTKYNYLAVSVFVVAGDHSYSGGAQNSTHFVIQDFQS